MMMKLIYPLTGKVSITSYFGSRTDPITGQKGAFHPGIDFVSDVRTIVAPCDMKPVYRFFERYNPNERYDLTKESAAGKYMVAIVPGTDYALRFLHCDEIFFHSEPIIRKGEPIGIYGSTGYATGPHLHFETMLKWQHVDPNQFF